MFNFFKKGDKSFGKGGLADKPDPRDFKHEELANTFKAPIITWVEKTQEQWRKFPIFSQAQSFSCVGQTVAKLLGIENVLEENRFAQFSARDIYCRKYQPEGGMYYRDGMDIGFNHGATIEQLMPSQNKPEAEMRINDSTVLGDKIALVGKGGAYFSLPFTFDEIAGIVASGKAVALGTRFNSGQWATGEVKLAPGGQYGHAVAVIDYCLWKGQKALVFDNSWGTGWGFSGQGVITEDQLSGINAAWYFAGLPNNWQDTQAGGVKPKYKFTLDLASGSRGQEVTALQECLKWKGNFPAYIVPTGYYGGITMDSVKKFQTDNSLIITGNVNAETKMKLNSIFS